MLCNVRTFVREHVAQIGNGMWRNDSQFQRQRLMNNSQSCMVAPEGLYREWAFLFRFYGINNG